MTWLRHLQLLANQHFFSNKKSYCFNFPRSSPGIFLFISFFIILCLIFFLWGGGRGGGIFISTDNRKRKPDIYLSTRPLAPQRERKGDAKMKRNKKVSVSGFRLACERWKGRRLSPEIIDVQTNRRCGRTREFGRLLKNESKREEGGREVNGWRWWDKGGRKVMRRDEEESGESWRGGISLLFLTSLSSSLSYYWSSSPSSFSTFLFFLPHLHLHVHLLFFCSSSFNQLLSFLCFLINSIFLLFSLSLLPLLVVYLQSSFPLSPFFIFILPFPVVFAFFTSSPPFFFFFCFICFPCFPFPALLPSTVSLFHPLVLQLLVMSSSSSPVLLRVPRILHLPCFPLFPFHFCCFSFPKIVFSPSACF